MIGLVFRRFSKKLKVEKNPIVKLNYCVFFKVYVKKVKVDCKGHKKNQGTHNVLSKQNFDAAISNDQFDHLRILKKRQQVRFDAIYLTDSL